MYWGEKKEVPSLFVPGKCLGICTYLSILERTYRYGGPRIEEGKHHKGRAYPRSADWNRHDSRVPLPVRS